MYHVGKAVLALETVHAGHILSTRWYDLIKFGIISENWIQEKSECWDWSTLFPTNVPHLNSNPDWTLGPPPPSGDKDSVGSSHYY